MVNNLQDALVLVTGAGSGIGRATALAFAAEGARVVAVDLDGPAAQETAGACGAQSVAEKVDVTDFEAMTALAAAYGPLDVLINNAGVGMTGGFADHSIDDWRWIRGVNLDGVVHGCLAFGPAMLERRSGQVVNVSSGLGYTVRATEAAYCTTKAAVLALSQCLRAEWSPQGVGVTAICPGVINTPIVTATRYLGAQSDPGVRAGVERLFRRGHPPEAVARAVVEAVKADKAVVPVGWEARLGWALHRIAPVNVVQAMARRPIPSLLTRGRTR
jgi:NAD(P)-dependent dehydrogenase (short-subunit alcohol dehydrogenase family)